MGLEISEMMTNCPPFLVMFKGDTVKQTPVTTWRKKIRCAHRLLGRSDMSDGFGWAK